MGVTLSNLVTELELEVKRQIKELIERLMKEEREIYLEEHPETKGNGFYERKLFTKYGEIEDLSVPRVRDKGFRPKLLWGKRRASLDLGEVVLSLFASGASIRDVSRFLETVYGSYYSPSSISRLIKVTCEEVDKWRERELDKQYYVVYLDATFVSLRRGQVSKEPVYIALGIRPDGTRTILGFWIFGSEGESAANWEEVVKDIHSRGVREVTLFVADGLPGLHEAVKKYFPGSSFQLCVLHAVRNSLKKVRKKDTYAVSQDLKQIYTAPDKKSAEKAFDNFRTKWGKRYPSVTSSWSKNIDLLLTFLEFPVPIRRFIYTTNQLERLAKEIKRRTKVIEVFCEETALKRVVYLVLREIDERYQNRKLPGFQHFSDCSLGGT